MEYCIRCGCKLDLINEKQFCKNCGILIENQDINNEKNGKNKKRTYIG